MAGLTREMTCFCPPISDWGDWPRLNPKDRSAPRLICTVRVDILCAASVLTVLAVLAERPLCCLARDTCPKVPHTLFCLHVGFSTRSVTLHNAPAPGHRPCRHARVGLVLVTAVHPLQSCLRDASKEDSA